MPRSEQPSKICATCGRAFSNRRRYGANWLEVRHCSERCRRNKPAALDRAIEQKILAMLQSRAGTLCPSEVARELFGDSWNEQTERVRQAARRLVASNQIEMVQGGRIVDPSKARGEVRLRLR